MHVGWSIQGFSPREKYAIGARGPKASHPSGPFELSATTRLLAARDASQVFCLDLRFLEVAQIAKELVPGAALPQIWSLFKAFMLSSQI
jgi:hypothetical protein